MDKTQENTSGEQAPMISITNMNKYYGGFHALKDINLNVMSGERIVICGPSGSGKSTLIRCINRLEAHQAGEIVVEGVRLHEHMRGIDMVRSDVGMVFQQFNLFPHLSVLEKLNVRSHVGAQSV